jgi:hypothetical protein
VSGSLSGSGTIDIKLVGGPQRSIQVNSSSSTAVNVSGASGSIDLSQGGPTATGSDFAVVGPEAAIGNFVTGSNGSWIDPSTAISDPFALLSAPNLPATAPAVDYAATSGCPGTASGCDHYHPGYYPTGILVQRGKPTGSGATGLAVFDPGIYYLGSTAAGSVGLVADQNSCLRPSIDVGEGSGGTLFYFSGSNTLSVTSNSGKLVQKSGSTVIFDCQSPSDKVPLDKVKCVVSGPGATILPANVIANGGLTGNVLLGPCKPTTSGVNTAINYGDPLGLNDPLGEQRGMLFFQDRTASGVNPAWSGGGSFGLAGVMYFHNTASFNDTFSLGGGSSSDTFVVGEIIVDKLDLNGNPSITMDLNPNALYYTLKATLIQ